MVTKLTIEYDGRKFAGWARQPEERTVQEELERALRTVLGDSGLDGEPLRLAVAGRTDRGVHAWGQVASYAHEAVDPLRLNGLLDDDVAVLSAEPARGAASTPAATRRAGPTATACSRAARAARSSAAERSGGRLSSTREALWSCASELPGSHDFTAFTPTETEHSRFRCEVLSRRVARCR